ncbi:unnamed protein product [Rotaria sp. Silwood1]|nr:unnamed protein product [Rotaria sp. Silwood1]CAF1212562.1 unnamed protein product [Rotaria sp. Silwood1]CAF3465118.1 unnamed protein product [Rotaria sp. Silwood1]CAF4905476.1 unnamed protein product [Rotaria sp. Silwood1]
MLGKSNETLSQARDSFYDDDDDENSTVPATPVISSIRIVTSKPPIHRQQSQSNSSSSPSSCSSDHDVTDVSSLGGEHHQIQQKQKHEDHRRKSDHDQHHPFHLQSMRHVLLGSSVPTSRPPTPVHPQEELNKKHVRIITDETDKKHHHHHQQPYIHGHTKDYRRVRLTSSAINRQKQQQKIERENLKILERLQHTRPTRSLKRDELLSHYDRQMGYVSYPPSPIPSQIHLNSRPSSATIMSSTFSTSGRKSNNQSRPSSASHAMNSNNVRSRPASASTSIHGSSRSSSARRPIWNDRWQRHE